MLGQGRDRRTVDTSSIQARSGSCLGCYVSGADADVLHFIASCSSSLACKPSTAQDTYCTSNIRSRLSVLVDLCRAEAKRQEQARADEQHKTAVSALNSHLSRASSASGQTSSVAKIQAQHLRSKQIDTDDAWIAQLEPATRSLLVKKQPARLTAAERAEAR